MSTTLDQIGLRGSHFVLGNNPKNQFQTVAQQSFNNQPLQNQQQPTIKDQKIEDLIKEKKSNLRASHFQLGGNNEQYYNTTSNKTYTHYEDFKPITLSEEQRRDLRTHHFTMGQYGTQTQTMNNIAYDKKQIADNLQKDQLVQKAKMIDHHHNFRETPNIIMSTKYNDDYNKRYDEAALRQSLPHSELLQKELMLRNSHIVFGKDQVPFETIQQKDYQQKELKVKELKKVDFQETHFQLGTQKGELCTTNDIYHQQQPLNPSKLSDENLKDLRREQGNYYNTEFKQNYGQNIKIEPKIDHHSQFRKSNIDIGDKKVFPLTYQTAYSQNMVKQPFDQGSARLSAMDRKSNFHFGQCGNQLVSEQHANFKDIGGEAATLTKLQQSNLRASHFKFLDNLQETFQTTAKKDYAVSKNKQDIASIDPTQGKNLRTSHFTLGQDQAEYSSSMKQAHQPPLNGKAGQLSQQTALNLRTSHFQLQ